MSTYLKEYLDIYLGHRRYLLFWNRFYPVWDQKYPEIDIHFPNKTYDELTDEEKVTLVEAIAARRLVRGQTHLNPCLPNERYSKS